ncbi:MAG: hypothetical protein MK101_07980 [Phycisphaerales bacterium]|nr:hypothetical protein [Phycisphaerales bacterium]
MRVGTIAGHLALAALPVNADECIVSDNFNSWSDIWSLYASDSSTMQLVHQNYRLNARSPAGNNDPTPEFAAAVSFGWKIDMTQDWAMSGQWYINPPTPTLGDVGMAFILLLEGSPTNMDLRRAWTMGAGTYHDYVNGHYWTYESSNKWYDNQYYGDQIDYQRETQDTVYIWWDASTKRIYANDELHQINNAFISNLTDLSSADEAWVGFGGYVIGSVPSFLNSMWVDDFCVIYGNTVGGVVGACCMGDTCVQVAEAACVGSFAGLGVPCEECLCESPSTCTGDASNDQHVDRTDLELILAAWGESSCTNDMDSSGKVDILDLMIVLKHWGSCT